MILTLATVLRLGVIVPVESLEIKRQNSSGASSLSLVKRGAELLDAIGAGNRAEFLAKVRAVRDGYRVCGLAPIYMTLWAAGPVKGTWSAYAQCPADEDGVSFVSIAGALLYSTA